MIPSIVSRQVRETALDYLSTTFALGDGNFEHALVDFLDSQEGFRWNDEDHPEGRPVRLVGLRYPTPWARFDREADYRQAWAEFERRLGTKMSKGTPR